MSRKRIDRSCLVAITICVGLAACGGDGTNEQPVQSAPVPPVPHLSPGPAVSLKSALTTVAVGHPTMLFWKSTSDATSCEASGAWSGTQSIAGAMLVTAAVPGLHTYVLTCFGPGGRTNAAVELTAVEPMIVTAAPVVLAPPVIAGYPLRVSAMPAGSLGNVELAAAGGISIYREDFAARPLTSSQFVGRWFYYPTGAMPVVCGAVPFAAGSFSREGCLAWFDAQPGPGVGSSEPFLRSRAPWWVDSNHRHAEPPYTTPGLNPNPGLGYINVLAFVIPPTSVHTPADLLGATVNMKLRKDAAFRTLEASSRVGRRSGHVYFWFQTAPRIVSPCTPDPLIGEDCTRQSDYILADANLTEAGYQIDSQLTADNWSRVSVQMLADPRHWTCLGRGDNVKYDCMPIREALRDIVAIGLIIAPVCTAPDPGPRAVYTCPWNAPTAAANSNTGAIDVADISIVAPLTQSVIWTGLSQVDAPDASGTLVKNATALAAWNAGAASEQQVADGSVSVEFEVSDASGSRLVGLTHLFRPDTPDVMDFALRLGADGTLSTSEAGVVYWLPPPYNLYRPGDRFRIHIESDGEGGRVLYFRNDELLPDRPRTLAAPRRVYPMRAAAAIFTPGASVMRASIHAPSWRLERPAAWQPVAGGPVTTEFPQGQTMAIVAADVDGTIAGGVGHVEFSAGKFDGAKALGLVAVGTAADASITYGLFMQDGNIDVVENGLYRATLAGPFSGSDRLRITAENESGNTVIRYFKNFRPGAKPFWTTRPVEPAFKLQVRGAVYDTAGRMGDTGWDSSGETVIWKPAVLGTNVAGPWGRLTRGSTATGAWDAASYTTRAITSGDGYVEFTVPDTRKILRLGLGTPYSGTDVHKLGFHLYVPSTETTQDLFVVEPTPVGQSVTYRSVG